MSYRTAVLVCLSSLATWSAGLAGDKQAIQVERLGPMSRQDIVIAPSLAAADTCYVSDNQTLSYRIDNWVTGFELYKSLMNPANQCTNPYPYSIMAVNMPMGFSKSTTLTISVDIEAVDYTTVVGCPLPGVLLAISSDYTVTIPSSGYYNIWIPLDTPVTVSGPFFAGFYIGNAVDTAAHVALLTDATPVTCATYNIWDDTVGWVDLADNDYYNFPGRLGMEVAGTPGGSPALVPSLQIVTPSTGDVLYGNAELWAWDKSLTGAIDYVKFEYSNGGAFTEIGRDFDGTSPNRNGIATSESGQAYNVTWDFSALSEGLYTLRATQVPTAGSPTTATIAVYLEPTPPVATIVSPNESAPFCLPVNIYMNCNDENLTFTRIDRRQAASNVTIGVSPVNQATCGDVDGDTTDGNYVANGEYGGYYSGPVAATMAAVVWSNRGYPGLMRQVATPLSFRQVAELLATSFATRTNKGTYDEAFLTGLKAYTAARGGGFNYEFQRNPSYSDLRIWVEDQAKVVILGLGGTPGLWVTVDGFTGWLRGDTTYQVNVANPLTGTIQSASLRNRTGYSEISLSGVWHRVEIMVSMFASAYSVTRTYVGADMDGSDGWMVRWTGTGIADGTHHYLYASTEDVDNHTAGRTALVELNCATAYVHGDYDGDRSTTIADLYVLIDFISRIGGAPTGGAARADCNCDNVINVADVIYYMNYLFGQASAPCR
jgi:hypothetical protein